MKWRQEEGLSRRAPILYAPNLDRCTGLAPQKRLLEDKMGRRAPALRRERGGRGCWPRPAGAALEVGCTGATVPAPNKACRVTKTGRWWCHAEVVINTSPGTCQSIPGTRPLQTSYNPWPGKARVSARSSGSSRSGRCSWAAGPCPGRSTAAPSRSCTERSSVMPHTDNLRRRGAVAVTRWLL